METHERQLEQPEKPKSMVEIIGEGRLYGVVDRGLLRIDHSVESSHPPRPMAPAAEAVVHATEAIVTQAQEALDEQVAAQTPEVLDMAERIVRDAEATRVQPGQAVEAPVAAATEAEETAAYLQNARNAVDAAAAIDYPTNPGFAASPLDAQATTNVATLEQATGAVALEVDRTLQDYLAAPESMN